MISTLPGEPLFSTGDVRLSSRSYPFDVVSTDSEVHHWFWARTALYQGIRTMEPDDRTDVLVPDYHCATAIEPVLRAGCRPVYYNVRVDCSVDVDELQSMIRPTTRAILVVHYFGVTQDFAAVRRLCDSAGIYLIEDCAHCWVSRVAPSSPGMLGDIAVFSPRKLFPVFDGGLLVIHRSSLRGRVRPRAPGIDLELRSMKFVFDRRVFRPRKLGTPADAPHEAPSRTTPPTRQTNETITNYDLTFNPRTEQLGMTRVSERLLRSARSHDVVETRRRNFLGLTDRLRGLRGVSCPDLHDGCTGPWVVPATVPAITDPHRRLRAIGIPAAAWEDVIHPSLDLADHAGAGFLYHHLMFLPCHQSLTDVDLDEIASRVDDVLR